MSNFKIVTLLTASAALLVAEGAIAGDMSSKASADKRDVSVTQTANTRVLSAPSEGLIPVTDENGNKFYNQIVATEDLQDVDIEIDVVDTFTYEYQGRIYTNKIVK